jgi:hypothetical protein
MLTRDLASRLGRAELRSEKSFTTWTDLEREAQRSKRRFLLKSASKLEVEVQWHLQLLSSN